MAQPEMPKWFSDDGSPVSCTEKIKVMSQNMDELFQAAQDAFEDALLMGCSGRRCANICSSWFAVWKIRIGRQKSSLHFLKNLYL